MKISSPFAFVLFACAVIPGGLLADSVTLNSGEKVEGKILSKSDTEVTIEVKVSESIKDERVIQRADIKVGGIEEATEDDIAFNEIKGIQINPKNSLAPESYDAALARLKEFAEKYPLSSHLAALKETIAAFEAESKRVQGGEIKIFGKWISKEEAEKQKYQIQAQVLLATMRAAASRGDNVGALNTFDELERVYPGSSAYPEAVGLARQALGSLSVQVANGERMIAMQKQQFQQVLDGTQEPKKSELVRAMSNQAARDEAAFNAAKGKWKIFIPRSEKSVVGLKQMIPNELTRLATLPVQGMKDSIAATDAARQALEAKNFAAAKDSIEKAKTLWAQNQAVIGLGNDLKSAEDETAKATVKAAAAAAAKAAAASQAEEAAAQKKTKEEATPFYMTLKGALMILGGVIGVIAVGTAISKVMQSRAAKKEDRE